MPEIPGYYFDSKRGKWFKVQPNHLATPSIAYSADNVRQVKMEREGKRRKLEDIENDLTMSKVSHVTPQSRSNAYKAGMHREIGELYKHPSLRTVQGTAWGEQLCFDFNVHGYYRAFTACVWDGIARSFIYGSYTLGDVSQSKPSIEFVCNSEAQTIDIAPPVGTISQITSITLSASRVAAATIDGGVNGPYVRAISIPDPFDDVMRALRDSREMDVYLNPDSGLPLCCSAVPYTPNQAQFVIGTDQMLELTELRTDGTWRPICNNIRKMTGRDVMNRDLAWVNPFTVATGQATGFVKLWDIRGQETVLSIKHNEPVEKVRCCEANMFVIQGQGGTVSLYDTRMATGNKAGNRAPRHHVIDYTTPTSFRSAGLDIQYDFGLVALARWESGSFKIEIRALRTGELVRTIKLCASTYSDQSGDIDWRGPDYKYGPIELVFVEDGAAGWALACLSSRKMSLYT